MITSFPASEQEAYRYYRQLNDAAKLVDLHHLVNLENEVANPTTNQDDEVPVSESNDQTQEFSEELLKVQLLSSHVWQYIVNISDAYEVGKNYAEMAVLVYLIIHWLV